MRNQISISLGKQHDAWCSFAKQNGERPATLATKVLQAFLVNQKAQVSEFVSSKVQAKRGFYVRLNDDELKALDNIAERCQRSRKQVLIAIIRNAITQEPQFSLSEETTLKESTRQLSRIGVNLNQIARSLNYLSQDKQARSFEISEVLKLLKLDCNQNLVSAINNHVNKVWRLINAAKYRYPLNKETNHD